MFRGITTCLIYLFLTPSFKQQLGCKFDIVEIVPSLCLRRFIYIYIYIYTDSMEPPVAKVCWQVTYIYIYFLKKCIIFANYSVSHSHRRGLHSIVFAEDGCFRFDLHKWL